MNPISSGIHVHCVMDYLGDLYIKHCCQPCEDLFSIIPPQKAIALATRFTRHDSDSQAIESMLVASIIFFSGFSVGDFPITVTSVESAKITCFLRLYNNELINQSRKNKLCYSVIYSCR